MSKDYDHAELLYRILPAVYRERDDTGDLKKLLSGCGLLLDVNNIFVNAVNHRYDPAAFLRALPADRVWYLHTAGHYVEAPDLRVDTHGAAVCDEVWALLAAAYEHCGPLPTLLERDFNFPPLEELVTEVERVRGLQGQAGAARREGSA